MKTSNVINKNDSYIVLSPYVGSKLDKVKEEALKVALERDIEVRFKFNGKEYKTSKSKIISYSFDII